MGNAVVGPLKYTQFRPVEPSVEGVLTELEGIDSYGGLLWVRTQKHRGAYKAKGFSANR